MRHLALRLLCFFTVFGTAANAASEARFSRSLTTAESSRLGVDRLNSDQTAILDALVRRDIDAKPSAAAPKAPRFTQRLSADELRNSGLESLADAQREQLDGMVQQFEHPVPLSLSSNATGDRSNLTPLNSKSLDRPLEIHGSISLMYGVGSHGYSERGGAMELTYDDPKGFSVGVGYAEVHTKGGYYDRYCRTGFPRYNDPLW